MKRRIYHVVKRGNDWQVRRQGARRASSCHLMKQWAVEWAQYQVFSSPTPAQIIVHRRDGTIQTEWTYGADPYWRKG